MTAYKTAFAFEAGGLSLLFLSFSLDEKRLECIADDASDKLKHKWLD